MSSYKFFGNFHAFILLAFYIDCRVGNAEFLKGCKYFMWELKVILNLLLWIKTLFFLFAFTNYSWYSNKFNALSIIYKSINNQLNIFSTYSIIPVLVWNNHVTLFISFNFSFSFISELMRELSMALEGNDSSFHTESAELIIQIKSMIDTGTSPVKV